VFTRDGLYYAIKPPHSYFAEYNEPQFLAFPQSSVKLASCAAAPRFRKVILKWKTASEAENIGFNIYRMEAKGGKAVKLNPALISTKGSANRGAAYQFIDTDVTPHKTYYYRLESVGQNNSATVHDIMSATPRILFWLKK
jgi:hypothetical protein